MTDEYDKIITIRSDSERFVNEIKSKFVNLQDLIGELVTNFLMSKTSELISEEKEEREKIFKEVKIQVSEVKTTVEDEKKRNSELMKKLEALDLTLTPTVYSERGSIYLDQGNFIKAIENFDQAIKLKGDDSKAYIYRGLAYQRIKDYDKAIKDYKKSTEIEPRNKAAFLNLGVCYLEKNEYENAIANLNKAIELDPKYAFAHYYKSKTYRHMKKYDLAINESKEALKIDPNNPSYLACLGIDYGRMGDYKSAIEYYFKSNEKKKELSTMMNLAEAYICNKDYIEAEKLANECYSMASSIREKVFSKYLLLLALILNNKEYKIELKAFAEVVKSSTDFKTGEWSFDEISDCLKKDDTMSMQAVELVKKLVGFLKGEIKEEALFS